MIDFVLLKLKHFQLFFKKVVIRNTIFCIKRDVNLMGTGCVKGYKNVPN